MDNLERFFQKISPHVLSLLRIVVAGLFLMHGSQKLFGFPGGGGTLNALGLAAGIIEFYGGLLVLLGLWTRLFSFILSGEMAVAFFLIHAKWALGITGLLPILNRGELAAVYCFIFFYLAFAGGGIWSIDHLFRRDKAAPAKMPTDVASSESMQ